MSDDVKSDDKSEKKKPRPPRPERSSVTQHSTVIDGHSLAYTATAGTLNLKNDRDEDRASLFYVAIVLDGVGDPGTRPVTFCFNGGPGSSSVWLQLGALGPRRVDVPDTLDAPPPPVRLVDNAHGMLDHTDLVFIDPVGTGFSRTVGETDDKAFWGVKEDVESVGEFITRWLARNGRWNSPRFLAGESYGTTRAAGLAQHLQERGVSLNGIVLLSLALNFQSFVFEPGNDLPEILYLPSYAAAAWYHHRLKDRPTELAPFLDEVRAFALEVYAPALLKGARLDAATRQRVARRLARYTGLDAEAIVERDLRIHYLWFTKQILGKFGQTIGRLDCRYTGDDVNPGSPTTERDPSYDAIYGSYAAAVNDYLRRSLGWQSDDDYAVLSELANESWRWQHGKRMGYINVTEDLRRALIANPHLKVLIANGIYDLATPFFAAEYTADHLEVSPALRKNVTLTYYDAGHMMYLHPPSLEKLKADLSAFYQGALRR